MTVENELSKQQETFGLVQKLTACSLNNADLQPGETQEFNEERKTRSFPYSQRLIDTLFCIMFT